MYRSFFCAVFGVAILFSYIKNVYAEEPAKIQICGQSITTPGEWQKNLPPITAAMHRAASFYPELNPSAVTRTNQCVADGGDCEEREKSEGGSELMDGIPDPGKNLSDSQIKAFHKSASKEDFESARDDSAFAVGHGYIRNSAKFFLLFRTHEDRKFHENAEGIDLVSAQALEQEAKEQERLSEVIQEVKEKISAKDAESHIALDRYGVIAFNQANALKLLACEFKTMANINREIENRMTGIIKDFIEPDQERLLQAVAIKEEAMFGKKSDITGIEKEEVIGIELHQNQGQGRNLASDNLMNINDPLGVFPIFDELLDDAENNAIWQGSSENDLFGRVRQQYSGRYKRGEFNPTILDEN